MARKFRLLRAEEIDCRINTISEKSLTLLLYKDARCDMNILDETVGPENWQRSHEVINGNLFCNVAIHVDRDDSRFGEWVVKQDVGTESYTEKEKGQASDSFKRACTNWGIGRELYTAPTIRIYADKFSLVQGKNGKPATYDNFVVDAIDYDDNYNISYLRIKNTKRNIIVFTWGQKPEGEPEPDVPDAEKKIGEKEVRILERLCLANNMDETAITNEYGAERLEDMTVSQYADFMNRLKKNHESKSKNQ